MTTNQDTAPDDATLEKYRVHARQWLERNLERRPPQSNEMRTLWDTTERSPDELAAQRSLQRRLSEAGYAGITWPRVYGGQGLHPAYERVFNLEARDFVLPDLGVVGGATFNVCAPTMLAHASPDFLVRNVPRIVAGDMLVAQFFSDPDAGSDLAAVRTQAVRDGDRWILSGSKIWSSGAYYADVGMCLARTNWDVPKHRGLTWFLVPVRADGITIERIRQINGNSEFCQEFFDDVVLTDDDVIGDVNDGWSITQTMLLYERGAGTTRAQSIQPARVGVKPDVLELVRATGGWQNPMVRDLVAQVHVDDLARAALARRLGSLMSMNPTAAVNLASYGKLASGVFDPIRANHMMRIAGEAAIAWDHPARPGAAAALGLLNSRFMAIAGGTTQMQRNSIGERVLGLPREPSFDNRKPFRDVVRDAAQLVRSGQLMAERTDREGQHALIAALKAQLTAPGTYFEIGEENVRGTTMPVFTHRVRSLRELLHGTARYADRTYLVEDDVRLDFGTHLDLVDHLAAALQAEYSVQPGDRVALFAANRWEWVVGFWAITTIGAIPAAYNGFWTPDEYTHATALVEPVLVIGDHARLARAAEAEPRPALLDLDAVGSLVDAHRGARPSPVDIDEDDPAILIFTSGTTGRPKAVTTPHRGVVGFGQVNSYGEALARVVAGGEAPRQGHHLPLGDDVVLVTSPLFHTSMLFGVVLRSVVKGSTGVLLPGRFDPERVLHAIERERVTSWLALGSAAPRVCAHPGRGRYDTSSLQHIGIGGAPVSPSVQQAIRTTFPAVADRLSMGYASTESVAVVANIAGPDLIAHPTSTGRTTVTTTVELRDENGEVIPDGELGEVHVRSPYIMLGYWRDPEASAAVLKSGGWLAMGDLGRLVDGFLYIDSRARDMILVSAENVSPTEVEHCLEAHPEVLEAAVFAVDDAVTGDAVCAVVVTESSTAVTREGLANFCAASLAGYKVPTHWHVVHDPLPRTASGKLMKHEIRGLVTS